LKSLNKRREIKNSEVRTPRRVLAKRRARVRVRDRVRVRKNRIILG